MKVLIVKNITREGPGLIGSLLRQHNIGHDIVDLYRGEKLPDLSGYSALFVMGGPDSANDSTPKMIEEIAIVKRATDAGIPFLGACLGMQVLVKANGGKILGSPFKEVGWTNPVDGFPFQINLTSDGKGDPLFEGLSSPIGIFHLHGETVELTPSMKLLATGKMCRNQAVKIGQNAYGLQGHFELTSEMFNVWAAEDPELVALPRGRLEADYKALKNGYEAAGNRILTNFFRIAKLIP